MDLSFEGQTVIVTGAGRGLGRAHALEFARRGATVVVNDNGCDVNGRGSDTSVADAVCEEIRAAGGRAIASYEDVAQYEGGYNVVKAAMDGTGRLDAVVCNAGILRDLAFHNMSEDDWDSSLGAHLKGCFTVLRAAWPVFRQQAYGRVVMTTSVSGLYGNFGQANYAAAKAGMVGLMNTLKLEGEKYNVTVNIISPAGGTRMSGTVPTRSNAIDPERPPMHPEQVSPAVVYMSSRECTDSGLVIHAQGGNFYRVAVMRGHGVAAEPGVEHDTEWVRANWARITDMANPYIMWDLRQTRDDHLAAR
ncbi:MAG: SDR family NAD(P)-dependent oxidoreductase [Dehalococcoidia bacterium]|nr:SDR family NAD(P)-dependent oxidoreductase [Dehalococcoidia bacterium]